MKGMQERYIGFDWLRLIAAIGIVGCHLALPNMTDGAWLIKRFTDLNVGVFAAIAGFFMAYSFSQKEIQLGTFLGRRVKRLLTPLYLWSIFYIGIDVIFDTFSSKPLSFQPLSLSYWYSILVCGNAATQTWFLIALFYTQVLLCGFVKKDFFTKSAWMTVFLVSLFVIGAFFSYQSSWWTYYFLRLFSFFLLGIAMFRARALLQRIPLWVVGIILIVGIVLVGNGFKYGFLGECIVSIPMLLLGLNWKPTNTTIQTIGQTLGALSFGVYLIHPIFTRMMGLIISKAGLSSNAIVFLLDLVIASACSLLATWMLKSVIKRFPLFAVLLPS